MRFATFGQSAAQGPGPALPRGLRWLERRQARAGALVLARALVDDPVNVLLVPDRVRRQEVLPVIFEFWLRFACVAGRACVTSGRLEGVAVWFESERLRMSFREALRCGGLRMVLSVERRVLVRYQKLERFVRNVQKRIVPEPHLYLSALGVDPEYQGRGHGRRLMETVLAQADREGRTCYLETELERNVDFYRRFGFGVAEELTLPGASVNVWAMVRRPELRRGAEDTGSA